MKKASVYIPDSTSLDLVSTVLVLVVVLVTLTYRFTPM